MADRVILIDKEIIERCRSGDLVNDLCRNDSEKENPDSLLNRCVALHNDGQIDLLNLIKSSQFSAVTGPPFFIAQHFFCEAIPKLKASEIFLMQIVQLLVAKGGADFAANMPNAAFREWCVKNLDKAKVITQKAKEGDKLSIAFASQTLQALCDVELARTFVTQYLDERLLSGIFALGHIKSCDVQEAEATIKILQPFLDANRDEAVRYNALMSILNICDQFHDIAAPHISNTITAIADTPTDGVLFNLARALWLHGKLFDRPSTKAALDVFLKVGQQRNIPLGIINEIDVVLSRLLAGTNSDLALDFLTSFLAATSAEWNLHQLNTIEHELATGDRERLFKLITRWLLSGNARLSGFVSNLVALGVREKPFDTSTSNLELTPDQSVLLAFRTLGWLFIHDVAAASILVACIRGADRASAQKIGELLFDPLLVNYGGKARLFLKGIKPSDPAYKVIRTALKKSDLYFKSLDINEPIKELWPSEYQRNAERTRSHDMMQAAHKAAEKESIFLNLVHRSTILYGRKAITFVGPKGKQKMVHMDMHPFSTSAELPRLEILDPVGLSLMLLTFRNMKLK